MDESKEFLQALMREFTPEGSPIENWSKLDTILAKARRIADERSA